MPLGGGIQTLGDGVQTSAGSEWHSGVSISGMSIRVSGISSISSVSQISTITIVGISIGISRALANMVGRDDSSLGHSIQTLGDGVQASAGSEWHSGVSIS